MPERDCFRRGQPLGTAMGVYRHPSVFGHSGKLQQDTLLDGQPTLTEAMVPLGLPVGSLRAALISSAPQINVGEAGMPAEPASRRQPLQNTVSARAELSGTLRWGFPCLPEASLRMLTVPGSPGPRGCGTPGGGWLHDAAASAGWDLEGI